MNSALKANVSIYTASCPVTGTAYDALHLNHWQTISTYTWSIQLCFNYCAKTTGSRVFIDTAVRSRSTLSERLPCKVRRCSKPGSLDRESESVDIAPRASSTPCVVTVRDPGRGLTKQSDTCGCAGNSLGRDVCRVNEYYHAETSRPASRSPGRKQTIYVPHCCERRCSV